MSAIEATLITSTLVSLLGLGVAVVSAWWDKDEPFVVGTVLIGVGFLGLLGGLTWAVTR